MSPLSEPEVDDFIKSPKPDEPFMYLSNRLTNSLSFIVGLDILSPVDCEGDVQLSHSEIDEFANNVTISMCVFFYHPCSWLLLS